MDHLSPCLKLATGGNDLKIWDVPSFHLSHQVAPESSSIKCLSWSVDGQQLGYISSTGDKVVLSRLQEDSLKCTDVSTKNPVTCIEFSTYGPRYFAIGCRNGSVLLWDQKNKKSRHTYKVHNSDVNCVNFNWSYTHFASGSLSGNIFLHNVKTGQSTHLTEATRKQVVRALKYSQEVKSMLGTALDDGSVALWDTNKKILLRQFDTVHTAPAMGLVFSARCSSLLISIGLDKKIALYNTNTKRHITTITCDAPLTAVDLMEDGVTLGLGNSRGRVTMYDLRFCSQPTKDFPAHHSSVQSLGFQRSAAFKQMQVQGDMVPLNMIQSDVEINTKQVDLNGTSSNQVVSGLYGGGDHTVETPPRNHEWGIFSPIRQSFPSELSSGTASSVNDVTADVNTPPQVGIFPGGIYSPLQESVNNKMQVTSENVSTSLNNTKRHSQDSSLPYTSSSAIIETHCQLDQMSEKRSRLESYDASADNTTVSKSAWQQNQNITIRSPPKESASPNSLPWMVDKVRALKQQPIVGKELDTIHSNRTIRPDGRIKLPSLHDTPLSNVQSPSSKPDMPVPEESHITPSNQSHASPQDFQAEYIRQIVEDVMEETRESIHRDNVHFHVQMLRQFQHQLSEIQSLLQHYSINEELAAEVARLKEENTLLRSKF